MPEPLKNMYNEKFINNLSSSVIKSYPKFDGKNFKKVIFGEDWPEKELKERMRHITLTLNRFLPKGFLRSIKVLEKVAKSAQRESFEYMIFPDYVEVFGQDFWDESLRALELFTQTSSSEFAVRPFIIKAPEKMMKTMLSWSKHKNYHVRRLASEGCRPRLPWACALPLFKKDPSSVLPILESLKADPELYVRRSVANNLNDISKDNPKIVTDLLKKWNRDKSEEMQWLIRHSLRGLEKKGDKAALEILGFKQNPKIDITNFKLKKKSIILGGHLEFGLILHSKINKDQTILIDYIINHVKSNGELTPKVFKWTKKLLKGKASLQLTKKHSIREISTRKYYSGKHEILIQINGKIILQDQFKLKVP